MIHQIINTGQFFGTLHKGHYTWFVFLAFVFASYAQSQDQNYVKTTVYKKASATASIDPEDPADAAVHIQYLDGLGRPVQQVAYKQSASGKDIISHIRYDASGREEKTFLPYIRGSASKDFDPLAETNQESFYASNNPSLTGHLHFATTQYAYSQKQFEASPLNRIFKQAAPGDAWALGGGKELKFDYLANEAEEVVLFKAVSNWSSALGLYAIEMSKEGHYTAGQLRKTVIKDEHWTSGKNHTTEEFTDKQDRVVLKRTYTDYSENSQTEVPHDTYYVYDQFGNLTYVIPPLAAAETTISQTILDRLCYQYKYDWKNRLVEKKQPGKDWEYVVYDKQDRVVMTGPARPPFRNLSNNGWLLIKYDAFNRVVMTGWISATVNNSQRKNHQTERDNQTENFHESRLSPGNTTNYTHSGVATPHSYTNVSLPVSGYYILTVNYYDDYNYADAPAVPAEVAEQPVYYNNTVLPKGLPTGKWARVLSTTSSIRKETSYVLYDKKARPLRTFVRNHENSPGGYTHTDMSYDFEGKITATETFHKRINSESAIAVKNGFTYSDQGRLLTHTHQVNSNPIQLLAANTYDELGRLISKKTGNTVGEPLQKTDYRYNIRGWLTQVNDTDSLTQSGDPTDLFAFTLNYNTVANNVNNAVKPLYNGNIAETLWRTGSDNILRSYSYSYDEVNRLKNAYYHKNHVLSESYDEHLTYDRNGNIRSLIRNGASDIDVPAIETDNLEYAYEDYSNRLIKVTDGTTPSYNDGFNDGADNAEEYGYDGFGNMIRDDNKGIVNIRYNHLNLPVEIEFATGDKIQYVYTAEGKRLEKTVEENSVTTTTKYLEGFQYRNNVLQFFPHAEGYVARSGSSYHYVFQHKDHLGNVRLSYARNPTSGLTEIIGENNYYPFGLQHAGYNNDVWLTHGNSEAQKYKFNDREFQAELELNMTAMDFRQYDNALGRFMAMDRLTELAPGITPYRFAFNNPNYWSDPTGLFETREAALAHINQFGLTGATIHFDDYKGVWSITNQGYTFYQKDKVMVVAYNIEGGGVGIAMLGGVGSNSGSGFAGGADFGGSFLGAFDFGGSKDFGNNPINWNTVGNAMTFGGIAYYSLEKSIHNSKYWVDAKGAVRSTELLKKGPNGKYVRGVQGLRNSQAATARAASSYSVAGKVVGGIGMGVTVLQYATGQISGTEASVDLIMGAIGFTGWGAPISLLYFGGKFIYEYSTGKPLFEKPTGN